jgi:hypothetical protein
MISKNFEKYKGKIGNCQKICFLARRRFYNQVLNSRVFSQFLNALWHK